MKTPLLTASLGLIAGLLLVSGCVERRVVYRERPRPVVVQEQPAVVAPPPAETTVVVTEAPPPLSREVIVARPGPNHVWIPGVWEWHGRWVWIGGRWVIGPHPRAAWVPGHWMHRGHNYVFVRGYWR
ncbi:MAG TPA: YXWGXW repeat-containing protein [Verrucomicrobiae bacterium]